MRSLCLGLQRHDGISHIALSSLCAGFLAIAVPKATLRPIQDKLNAPINEAISSPDIHHRLVNAFALTARSSREQCAAQDRDERAKGRTACGSPGSSRSSDGTRTPVVRGCMLAR